mmetsp:Transcript_101823/g.287232  ORF Transcript_101823/g.287232 Transcript_101823/m.287232 type:complete len:408 (+) Transcript_101823:41-1264(+)
MVDFDVAFAWATGGGFDVVPHPAVLRQHRPATPSTQRSRALGGFSLGRPEHRRPRQPGHFAWRGCGESPRVLGRGFRALLSGAELLTPACGLLGLRPVRRRRMQQKALRRAMVVLQAAGNFTVASEAIGAGTVAAEAFGVGELSAIVQTSGNRPAAGPTHGRTAGIGRIVYHLYDNFNRCDVDGTAECFTEDVVYEDLLLGNSTIVESREDFREVIGTHPVFLWRTFCTSSRLPITDIAVRVDSIAEDAARGTVGVEWHVEVDGRPLAMGRGLSFMRICSRTGLIEHAVDIAEAPWRAVGLVVAPFARGLRMAARLWTSIITPSLMVSLGTLTLFGPLLLFLDKRTMDEIRDYVDNIDDFRGRLDAVLAQAENPTTTTLRYLPLEGVLGELATVSSDALWDVQSLGP